MASEWEHKNVLDVESRQLIKLQSLNWYYISFTTRKSSSYVLVLNYRSKQLPKTAWPLCFVSFWCNRSFAMVTWYMDGKLRTRTSKRKILSSWTSLQDVSLFYFCFHWCIRRWIDLRSLCWWCLFDLHWQKFVEFPQVLLQFPCKLLRFWRH